MNMIKIIFGIICLLAGLGTSIVAIYGMSESLKTKDIGGIIFSATLMLMCAVTIVGGVGYCIP